MFESAVPGTKSESCGARNSVHDRAPIPFVRQLQSNQTYDSRAILCLFAVCASPAIWCLVAIWCLFVMLLLRVGVTASHVRGVFLVIAIPFEKIQDAGSRCEVLQKPSAMPAICRRSTWKQVHPSALAPTMLRNPQAEVRTGMFKAGQLKYATVRQRMQCNH